MPDFYGAIFIKGMATANPQLARNIQKVEYKKMLPNKIKNVAKGPQNRRLATLESVLTMCYYRLLKISESNNASIVERAYPYRHRILSCVLYHLCHVSFASLRLPSLRW